VCSSTEPKQSAIRFLAPLGLLLALLLAHFSPIVEAWDGGETSLKSANRLSGGGGGHGTPPPGMREKLPAPPPGP
jgi:hypothetical protein